MPSRKFMEISNSFLLAMKIMLPCTKKSKVRIDQEDFLVFHVHEFVFEKEDRLARLDFLWLGERADLAPGVKTVLVMLKLYDIRPRIEQVLIFVGDGIVKAGVYRYLDLGEIGSLCRNREQRVIAVGVVEIVLGQVTVLALQLIGHITLQSLLELGIGVDAQH